MMRWWFQMSNSIAGGLLWATNTTNKHSLLWLLPAFPLAAYSFILFVVQTSRTDNARSPAGDKL